MHVCPGPQQLLPQQSCDAGQQVLSGPQALLPVAQHVFVLLNPSTQLSPELQHPLLQTGPWVSGQQMPRFRSAQVLPVPQQKGLVVPQHSSGAQASPPQHASPVAPPEQCPSQLSGQHGCPGAWQSWLHAFSSSMQLAPLTKAHGMHTAADVTAPMPHEM